MINRKYMAAGLSTIGLLTLFASGLEADDFAYALGSTDLLGTIDLNSGAFTVIGTMGSGGYSGLAVANGVLYTEQNGLLFSVNTSNANLTLIGGLTGNNLATFGSTTTGLYGLAGSGPQSVATLFSINPQTGAITAIGPLGVIGNGQGFYARLSVGSSTLYMENASNLYTINTTTGAGTQVGTVDSNGYLTSVLLFENGTFYDAFGSGIGTVNVATGQITPHSSVMGGNNNVSALAPLSTSSGPLVTSLLPQLAFGGAWYSALYFTNTTNNPVSFTTSFFGNDGTPLDVAALGGTSVTTNLAARGTALIEFPNLDSTVLGYASAALPSGVTGYGVFRQSIPGIHDQEAVVPLSINTATVSTLLFDDTKYVTAFAIVNLSSAANTIAVTARDPQGNTLGTATVPLAANAKTSMALSGIIPAIKGALGSVDFSVSSGNLAVLGLRFNGLAFTSIPTSTR